MFDVAEIRREFPMLEKGVTYLDSAASSLTPEQVVLNELEFYHEHRANVEHARCVLPPEKRAVRPTDGTVRASTYLYNTTDGMDRLIGAVEEIARKSTE